MVSIGTSSDVSDKGLMIACCTGFRNAFENGP
jgi:hypothetical protein